MKKIIAAICIILFFTITSCKEDKNKTEKDAVSTTKVDKTKNSSKKKNTSDRLKQNGSYTKLFNREAGNCDFITPEMLAEGLQVNADKIMPESNKCGFSLNEENGKTKRFFFVVEKWGNKQILKEIKTIKENEEMFGKDSRLTQYRISETGDTYLGMHQNRMVRILNEAQDTAIILLYTPAINPTEADNDKRNKLKDEAKDRAYAVANYLLKTYQ